MASTWPSEIVLLRELVSRPSVSGTEAALGAFVADSMQGRGLDATAGEAGVVVEVRGRGAGPTLALVSHLDTVPPGEGWTRDPFDPAVERGRLHGRGSGDAKASVAAMLSAALDVARSGGPAAGRLLVVLGHGEETRNTTMSALVAAAGPIDAAIVGEPTGLDFAIAQRGLMMIDLEARGDQRHAGHAGGEAAECQNAIVALSRDLVRLDGLFRERPHRLLGYPTVTPTMVASGVGRNVTPPRATAVLDVRSTPAWSHAELAARLRERLDCELIVTSDRLVPCETPAGSRLLGLAAEARPQARRFGSPTCSDWVFLAERDVIKCGPGASALSHTADESVSLAEVGDARRFYAAVAEAYLR